jgi:signal transduction histidine kinase
MRRRLIWTYLTLLTVVLMGLAIPLGLVLASRDSQTMFLDRRSDTAWFASLAEPALRTGRVDALSAEMRRYDELFGVAAVIVSRDGQIMLTSRGGVRVDSEDAQQSIAIALSGQPARFPGARWPWESAPLVVAEPVGSGGEVTGAALTISSAGALQSATWRSWIVLGSLSLFALLLGALSTGPVARWTLRPVHDLDEAAHALAAGKFLPKQVSRVGPPELRRLSESFAAMAARVTALLERQRTFASYASHQLRTPLATLRLSVENLAPAVDASGADDYELVAAEIERMAGMCDALLTYALAEVPAGPLTTVNASGVAAGRVAFWAGPASLAGMKITLHAPGVVPALAAPNVLDQALDALLSNAIKFAGPGASITVRVGTAGDDLVEVHVHDTGPGLSTHDLARAAEAFWRRPADQNAEGSGLGITIAQSLITASGGQLTLEQAVPHGLHAIISLRAVPATLRAAA